MDYEIAKELRDAGHPQKFGEPYRAVLPNGDRVASLIENTHPEAVYDPPLSELIRSCFYLYYPAHFQMGGMNVFWAVMRDEDNLKELVPVQYGNSPEEAVARLWIALRKKLKKKKI